MTNMHNKFSIVIPTMQKDISILNKLIKELEEDSCVDEIIIIDNSTKGFESEFKKVRVIVPKKNLYINPSWNLGVKESRNEYVGILNDDLLLPKNYCSEVLKFIENTEKVGLVGIDSTLINNTTKEDFEHYPEDKPLIFEPMNKSIDTYYWGSAIFGKKANFYLIPENLKIWCGDNYLQKINMDNGYQNYQISNTEIKHIKSMTLMAPELAKIREKDIYNYSKIDARFKNNTYYKSPFSQLFSIKKQNKHIIISILGIKMKFKSKKAYSSLKYPKDGKLICLYRLSDKSNDKNKIPFATKMHCLDNFISEFGIENLLVIADNCENETIEQIQQRTKNIIKTSLKNSRSFLYCVDYAINKFNDNDIVYFCEDDYLHKKDSKKILLEGINIADYVTLYDHPDKYINCTEPDGNPFINNGGENTKVFLTNSSHWKATNSTTMTFATSVKILKQDKKVFQDFCKESCPNDFKLWRILTRNFYNTKDKKYFIKNRLDQRILISAIPGISTHCESKYLSPLTNWNDI